MVPFLCTLEPFKNVCQIFIDIHDLPGWGLKKRPRGFLKCAYKLSLPCYNCTSTSESWAICFSFKDLKSNNNSNNVKLTTTTTTTVKLILKSAVYLNLCIISAFPAGRTTERTISNHYVKFSITICNCLRHETALYANNSCTLTSFTRNYLRQSKHPLSLCEPRNFVII